MDEHNLFRHSDDTALRIFTREVKNNFHSERLGRAVYDTGLYVEVLTPGSTESVPEFLVELTFGLDSGSEEGKPAATKRYAAYYDKYKDAIEAFKKNNGTGLLDGTPLRKWTAIDVGTAASLNAIGITTVEQLAKVSDGNLHNLGTGGRRLREMAVQFLNAQTFGIPTAQAGTQIAQLQERVAQLEAENAALRERVPAPAPAPMPEFATAAAPQSEGEALAPQPLADAFAALSGSVSDPPAVPAPATVI